MEENHTSKQLNEIWSQLSRNQRRFVVAMQECATKKEAAGMIGLDPQTIYKWPSIVDDAITAFSDDVENSVLHVMKSYASKAVMVKGDGLDSEDEKLRQSVATEIIDRVLGKPTQRQEHTGADGGPIAVKGYSQVSPDDWDD